MIVLDLTAIRAHMLRRYAQLKRDSAGNRQSLIRLLAQVAQDQIAPPSTFRSISLSTAPSLSLGTAPTLHVADAADTSSAATALTAVLLVVAEDLVDALETLDLADSADLAAPKAVEAAGGFRIDSESMRKIASDAALGCFAALCERGWAPAQILATENKVADHALAMLHRRVDITSRQSDAMFVAHFTTALDDLACAIDTMDSDHWTLHRAHRSRRQSR